MITDLELMRLHVEALFTHDADGRLVRVNEPNGGPAPRFFRGTTGDDTLLRFRHDVADDLVRDLEAASREAPMRADGRGRDAVLVTAQSAGVLRPLPAPWHARGYGTPKRPASLSAAIRRQLSD